MSELKDDGRIRAMLDAIRERFGPSQGPAGVPGRSLSTTSSNPFPSSQGMRSEGGTKKAGRVSEKGRAGPNRSVRRINNGSVVTIGGTAQFEAFGAELNDPMRDILDVIADVVSTKPNRLIIRGHAAPDRIPADSPYEDPLDLSFARAHSVADYLVQKGLDRRKVLVSAAGDTEPKIIKQGQTARSANHRVDVFLIDSYITRPQLPGSPEL
jgi:chemotaxis protein MotB